MKPLMLSIGIAAAVLIGCGRPALAQAPPMDMSWAVRQQMMYQQQGDMAAHQAAMAYYNHMLGLRANGYTGPSLPTGVTQQSLQNSINQLNQSYRSYNQSQMQNSMRRSNAVNDYGMRAIRGCTPFINQYGYRDYICY